MDYFAIKSPKTPTAGGSTARPPFGFNNYKSARECAKTLLNIFGWCRCYWCRPYWTILGPNKAYILCFCPLPVQKSFPRHLRKLIFIEDTNKFSI